MRKRIKRLFMVVIIFILCPAMANAGIALGGTRLIYDESKNAASIDVLNTNTQIYLIQSWVEGSEKLPAPFILTPPLFKIAKKSQRSLRIMKKAAPLPADRESLFWLNVKAIPLTDNDGSKIQVAVKTRIKLLYRPKGVERPDEHVGEKLSWSLQGGELLVTNPTPYYMSLYSVSLNQKELNEVKIVAPKTTARFSLPDVESHGVLSWKIINDFGVASQAMSRQL